MIFKVFDKSCVSPFGRGPGSVLPRHVIEAARRKTIKQCVTAVRAVIVVRGLTVLRAATVLKPLTALRAVTAVRGLTVLRAVTAVRAVRAVRGLSGREGRIELLQTPKPVSGQKLFRN